VHADVRAGGVHHHGHAAQVRGEADFGCFFRVKAKIRCN